MIEKISATTKSQLRSDHSPLPFPPHHESQQFVPFFSLFPPHLLAPSTAHSNECCHQFSSLRNPSPFNLRHHQPLRTPKSFLDPSFTLPPQKLSFSKPRTLLPSIMTSLWTPVPHVVLFFVHDRCLQSPWLDIHKSSPLSPSIFSLFSLLFNLDTS